MNQENVEPTAPVPEPPRKKTINSTIVLVGIVLFGLVVYLFLQNQELKRQLNPPSVSSSPLAQQLPTSIPSLISDTTASWKTYKNLRYNKAPDKQLAEDPNLYYATKHP